MEASSNKIQIDSGIPQGSSRNAAEMFWYPSPDLCLDTILSQISRDNSIDLMAWFLL
jgi:hypothetical protein